MRQKSKRATRWDKGLPRGPYPEGRKALSKQAPDIENTRAAIRAAQRQASELKTWAREEELTVVVRELDRVESSLARAAWTLRPLVGKSDHHAD